MAVPAKKSFDVPDEHIAVPGITADVIELADTTISRNVFQLGTHCPEISQEGKTSCLAHHTGYVIGGRLHVQMQDGSVIEAGPNEVFDIPPGHDGWAAVTFLSSRSTGQAFTPGSRSVPGAESC